MNELRIGFDAPHGPEWPDLLQDALDGALDDSARRQLDAHLGSCEVCAGELARLRELDARLTSHFVPMTLDTSFEQRVLDEIQRREAARVANARAAARARIEQQDRQLTYALERAWRSAKHMLFAKLAAMLAAALALALIGAAAFPGLDFEARYPELLTLAQQPLALICSGLVVAGVSLTFGLRYMRVT